MAESDLFFAETSALLVWDVLVHQEAFVKSEGIESDSKDIIYTSEQTVLGLRTPAIVVNGACPGKSRVLSSGIRWVAVELSLNRLTAVFVSIHLPHARAKTAADFQGTLQQVSNFLLSLWKNVHVSGRRCEYAHDWCMIGDTVPDDPDDDSDRPQHLYEFLQQHKLWLPNTW